MDKSQIEIRMTEIKSLLMGEEKVNCEELELEIRSLKDQLNEIEQKEKRNKMAQELNTVTNPVVVEKSGDVSESEKRGNLLKENRSVTVATTGVLLQEHMSSDIKPTFNEVSSLIDRVSTMNLPGGESFEQPYQKSFGEGDYKAETEAYASAEPTFDSAVISKAKVTAYAEVTEELVKLPAANYESVVIRGMSEALRKKITKEILVGSGATNHLTGIFDDGATAIDAATDKEITDIDETTLDEIIMSFGGDENVEDPAVLILNKKDLKKFKMLRTDDGAKVYDVKMNGNTGTIDGVPYVINSACYPTATATTGQYVMAYGPLSNYLLTVFSPVDIQRSTDFKFSTGFICHKASVFVGGNVVANNGFLRVKKA